MHKLELYFSDNEIIAYLHLHGYCTDTIHVRDCHYDEKRDDPKYEYIDIEVAYFTEGDRIEMDKLNSSEIYSKYSIYKVFDKEIKSRLLF